MWGNGARWSSSTRTWTRPERERSSTAILNRRAWDMQLDILAPLPILNHATRHVFLTTCVAQKCCELQMIIQHGGQQRTEKKSACNSLLISGKIKTKAWFIISIFVQAYLSCRLTYPGIFSTLPGQPSKNKLQLVFKCVKSTKKYCHWVGCYPVAREVV